jgi:hypothetical protein
MKAYAAQAQDSGRVLLRSFLSRQVSNEWLATADLDLIINEFVKALQEINLQRVYILMGADAPGASEQTERGLRAFLSSLNLFQNPHFLYKIVLPIRLQESMAAAGVIRRRRMRVYTLDWHVEDLITIVIKRTALAAGKPVNSLTEICEDEKLPLWLERTGGNSPRGWLESIAPLVAQYLRRQRTISTDEWHDIRVQSPPRFTFDPESENATVGWRRITDLPEVPRLLLSYLYEHRERVCTRSELYHRAYLPTRYPNATEEERREYSADNYDSVLDTAISRLRRRIEPDPRSPMYVITKRGKGYKLENAW